MPDDAVDEENIILCCAACCVNCGWYNDADCTGVSGRAGLLCVNCEICCKLGAPCLPCVCCGPVLDCDDCAIMEAQIQACCLVISAAFPCTDEVPAALSVAGLTVYPSVGCCVSIGDIKREAMQR